METPEDGNQTLEQQEPKTPVATKRNKRNDKPMPTEQMTEDKPKKARKMGLLPNAVSGKIVEFRGKVIGEDIWASLACNSLFAVDADAVRLYFKKSKSSFCDLTTGETTTGVPPAASNKVYRVSLL